MLHPTEDNLRLEVEQEFHEILIVILVQCRKDRYNLTVPTTTPVPLPIGSQNAINLAGSWRLEHQGKGLKPVSGKYN